MRHLIFLLLGLPLLASATATKTLNYADADIRDWGTGKLEDYDIAVRIAEPSLTGTGITRIEIPVIGGNATGGYSIWLSSRLELRDKKNSPDILAENVDADNGTIVLTLDSPYIIHEEGVYVGYSFTMNELTPEATAPISVSSSDNPDAFFIHTSRKYLSWGNFGLGLAADIAITVEGDFLDNAVSVAPIPDYEVVSGDSPTPSVTIYNHGSETVKSIDYEFTVDGRTETRHADYEPPLAANYSAATTLVVDMSAAGDAGTYPWSMTVTKVNGVDNHDSGKRATGDLYVFPYRPEHRPLMEEFTGTWCGWCPRGTVGMDGMAESYPELFVGVAIHVRDDVMNIGLPLPDYYPGAPGGILDRTIVADPYNGLSEETCKTYLDGIGKVWSDRRKQLAVADVGATAVWGDDDCTRIEINASAIFLRPYSNADFRFIYMITADDLSGTDKEWRQSNYFSGRDDYRDTDLEPLVDMNRKLEGMKFNDVLVLCPEPEGTENSIPRAVAYMTPIKHSRTFELVDAVNTDGMPLVQDKNRLHAIVAIVDASTGRIVNAVKTPVASPADITCPVIGAEAVEIRCYDLQGRLTDASCPGIYVKRVIRSDGTVTTEKFRR